MKQQITKALIVKFNNRLTLTKQKPPVFVVNHAAQIKKIPLNHMFYKLQTHPQTNTSLRLFLGKFLSRGLSLKTAHILNKTMMSTAALLAQSTDQVLSKNTMKLFLTNPLNLFFYFFKTAKAYYRVRYTALNRKIRKIVKNKYKYQKQYTWLLPRQRQAFVVNLLKACVSIQKDKRVESRLASVLFLHFSNFKESPVVKLIEQHQKVVVSQLVQTKK